MTGTCREAAVSSSEMPRPLTIGVPMTSKYPGVTRSHELELSSLGPGAGSPSTHTPENHPPPGGEYRHRATEETPGMPALESWMRRYSRESCAAREPASRGFILAT